MLRRSVLGLLASSTLVDPAWAQDDWAKTVEAAKKEGKLVMYTASIGSVFHKAVIKSFEQKYGIAVEVLEARASEVRERVRVEQAAGRFLGDIHHNGSTTTWRSRSTVASAGAWSISSRTSASSSCTASRPILPQFVRKMSAKDGATMARKP